MARKLIKICAGTLSVFVAAVMGVITYMNFTVSDNYYVFQNEAFTLQTGLGNVVSTNVTRNNTLAVTRENDQSKNVELKLFGLIPVKQARVETIERVMLTPCGTPFGVKILTQGVVVVGLNDITTDQGHVGPAKQAGLKTGDIVSSVGGKAVSSNDAIAEVVGASGGNALEIRFTRNSKEMNVTVTPVKSNIDGKYKIGLWVRDSSAGIGTVTFYEPNSGVFGGLGHPICDIDTGDILPLMSGEVVDVKINDVVKGMAGSPGELCGSFVSNEACGMIELNNGAGVFGTMEQNPVTSKGMEMALKQEIREGPVQIITTIDGNGPQVYEAEIEKLNMIEDSPSKNMVLHITDERLLEKTGGIVQGMSGSPIIQNGKLIGAVTHVFVNDPTRGYGIFIENMYNFAKTLEN